MHSITDKNFRGGMQLICSARLPGETHAYAGLK